MHQFHNPRRAQALTRLPELSELSTTVVREAQTFARRYKSVTGFYFLGLLVIGLLMITGGGRPMDSQQRQTYHRIMDSIDVEAEYAAESAVWGARHRYQSSKGWFWNCDSLCQRHKEQLKRAEQRLKELKAQTSGRVRQAKSVAGVTSDMAVTEMQNSFWSYFTAGKQSAKRRTMFDVFWMVLRSAMGSRGRDEGTAEYIVRILLHLLMNFTVGLFMALIMFVFSLWSIVYSYQPNPIVAVLIFVAAAAAATAFVTTYLLAMAGATFGGVYGVAKLAESSQRIAAQRERERLQGHHYD